MPGNELGDRVHNFFAQDNSSQGQHQLNVGNWPMLNNNSWLGSQRQIDVLNTSSKNYNSEDPETENDGGQSSYPVHATHGLNFSQSNLRPDFRKSQSQTEQQYPNGFMYGNQFDQNRQNDANFVAVDTDSDQRHLMASRGSSAHEFQQQGGREQEARASDQPETSGHPVSFDLFGGPQHMSHQQGSILQAFQRQQSGLNDMQELQQQLMIRKRQELQRNQQLQQLDVMPQNLINQIPPFTKQAAGSQSSTLVNGTPNSNANNYPWAAEPGTNWLSCGATTIQGSPSGLIFPPNLGQMGVVPQKIDQSLYGVPVSSSKGLALNQYAQIVTDRSSIPQMETSSNSLHSNQHHPLPDQSGRQEGASISRQKFQNENFRHASHQSSNTGITDMGGLQQVKSMQRNAPQREFPGRQEQVTRAETSHERSAGQVTSSQDEVALDPIEEKILYGSDDNIWSAFGKSSDMNGETGNVFVDDGLSNGFRSIQSGGWSALMQSAVGETSSSDIGGKEEWSGLNFHNTDGSLENQPFSITNNNVKQSSLHNQTMQTSSALSSGFISSSNDANAFNVMRLNRLGHKFQNVSIQRQLNDASQRYGQSLEETNKLSSGSPLQKSVAEGSQVYGNASQDSLHAERNAKTISGTWAPGQRGSRQQPNGWNALAAVPPDGDRLLNVRETEKLSQNSQNRVGVMQGNSLWKSDFASGSAVEFGTVQSAAGNHQEDKRVLGTASVSDSSKLGVDAGSRTFIQNNYLFNQWRNANPSAKAQGGEGLGRIQVNEHNQGSGSLNKDEVARHDIEIRGMRESSNDSHHSNISQHSSGGLKERFSNASESKSLPWEKQKLTDQLASKVTGPRKFQYHPMGNLDEDVEPTSGMKQSTQGELPKDNKGPERNPFRESFSDYAPSMAAPFSRSFSSYTNNVPSPSQNMLELLHKVDQSGDHGGIMHLSSSECNVSSRLPEVENFGGSAGHLQRTQSSVGRGFGLQLGPPSQRLQIPELSSPSQIAQGTVSSMDASHADAEMGEKNLLMVSTSPVQSLPFTSEESEGGFENDRFAGPNYSGNEKSLHNLPGHYHPSFRSDTPSVRSQLQNKQATRISGNVAMNQQVGSSFSCNTSCSVPRGSADTVLCDASHNIRKDNLVSYDIQERVLAASASTRDQMHTSQHFGMPGMSQQGASNQVLRNMWSTVPTSQRTLPAQYPKSPSHFSAFPQSNVVESTSQCDRDFSKGGRLSSKLSHSNSPGADGEVNRVKESSEQLVSFMNTDSTPKMEKSLGRTSSIENQMDDSLANSASTQDIEAFGRSLKPNIFSNEKYVLLNQMRALKDAEADPSNRVTKRKKGAEGLQNEDDEYSGIPSSSTSSVILQKKTLPYGNAASQDIVAAALDPSQRNPPNDCTTVRVEYHQANPQMAPSQFNQYVHFRNGEMLPMYNAQKLTSSTSEEPPLGKSSNDLDTPNLKDKTTALIDACEVGSTLLNPAPTSEANENLSDYKSLLLNVSGQCPVTLGPKKRKSATSELHPWHIDISDSSHNLSILSVADADWNKAANRLSEKVENDAQFVEDGSPVLRSKRRLILTTQLMQQLFCPPPATVLSTDVSSKYESVTYALSREALGDACRAVSYSSVLVLPQDGVELRSAKGKLTGGSCSAKVMELLGKARKLENDYLRLEKCGSMLDLRLECQDLEKFSVINRFAKFHGRGPSASDNAEASSSDATATTQRPVQRYVTAVPLPRILPDRVQCLSL